MTHACDPERLEHPTGCFPIPCTDGFECSTDGERECRPEVRFADLHGCVLLQCDSGYECRVGYECRPGVWAADDRGCALPQCDVTGISCDVGRDCLPESVRAGANGCLQRACSVDADCECGFCVNGGCEAQLGACYSPPPCIPTPYGCVWPDDEYV